MKRRRAQDRRRRELSPVSCSHLCNGTSPDGPSIIHGGPPRDGPPRVTWVHVEGASSWTHSDLGRIWPSSAGRRPLPVVVLALASNLVAPALARLATAGGGPLAARSRAVMAANGRGPLNRGANGRSVSGVRPTPTAFIPGWGVAGGQASRGRLASKMTSAGWRKGSGRFAEARIRAHPWRGWMGIEPTRDALSAPRRRF